MDSRQHTRNGCPVSFSGHCGDWTSFMMLILDILLAMVLILPSCSAFETTLDSSSSSLSSKTQSFKHDTKPIDNVSTPSTSDRDELNTTGALAASTKNIVLSPWTTPASGLHSAASPGRLFFPDDFILIEMVRLVFQGNVGTAGFPNKVYGLLESFLTRATRELKAIDGSDWSYELSSTLRPINFENTTTYMDFRIKHTAQQAISFVFTQLQLRSFMSQNSNLVLLAECWPSRNCQNGSATEIPQVSVLEKNFNVFTTVIVLCSLCLVVIVTGTMCSCLRRMENSKTANDFEAKEFSDNSKSILSQHNSSSQGQNVRGEMIHETSFYARAVDDDYDEEDHIHSTWVIPLEQALGRQGAVVVVTAEDTKL